MVECGCSASVLQLAATYSQRLDEADPMSQVSTQSVITSALSLPEGDRLAVLDAIQDSLLDPTLDHDGADPIGPTSSAWRDEVHSRLEDIDAGRVKTVSADAAEQLIRGNAKPTF